MTAAPEQIFKRCPPSTVRLEEAERGGQRVLLAVPSMRVVATSASPETVSRARELLAARRRDLTRPDGTCPACSGPLERQAPGGSHEVNYRLGWCPACSRFVKRAGPQ